jgi:hypothetical protein
MNILLKDFNAKASKEHIYKPTTGNGSLHEVSSNNGFRIANFATSKNFTVKSTLFPHGNILKYILTSPGRKTHNKMDHILIGNKGFQIYLISDR